MIKKYSFFILLFLALVIGTIFWWRFFGSFDISNDAAQYQEAALNLLENQNFRINGELSMMREPGYPFFLAVIYKIFGVHPWAVRVVQFLLHFGIVIITYFLAKKFFGNFSARLSSFSVAIYPMFNILTSWLISEILACFLVMIFLLIFYFASEKEKYYLYALAGLILGCLAMVKAIFAPAIVIFLVLIIFQKNKYSWRANLKKASVFLFFFLLLVVPWLFRNYSNFQQFSLSSRNGVVLFIRASRNNYDFEQAKKYIISSLSGEYLVRRFIDPNYNFENDYVGKSALRESMAKAGENLETDNYDKIDIELKKEAINLIKEHPVKYLFFGLIEVSNLNSPMIYYERHFSIFHDSIYGQAFLKIFLILVLRLIWWLFVGLVICAIYKSSREKKAVLYASILLILYINAIIFFLHGNPRFLIPAFPLYLMFCAYSLQILIGKLMRHSLV